MTAPLTEADPSGYLTAWLMGAERDDVTQPSGLCRGRDEQTPARLTLTLGTLTLHVRNHDTGPAVKGKVTAVYGCHGRILLEDITGPLAN